MNAICKELEYLGCDVEAALDRMLGQEEMFLSFVERALEQPEFEQLGAALDEKNVKLAFFTAHKLKGTLSNVGLNCMVEIMYNLVESLRIGIIDGLEQDFIAVIEKRNELLQVVKEG